jgi:BCD family chlorophyll transporter-like MFS transporter
MTVTAKPLGWLGIVRLGLVQTSLGAIVVLTTSTLNRVMVVELALPAMVPGFLIALHYTMQMFRPRLGFGSDVGGRRTPWIIGGMGILAAGGILAALATALMTVSVLGGIVLAVLAFVLIGIGVGAAGTTLLVLLAKRAGEDKRAAAATIVWVMMIAGFILTSAVAGHLLDPFSIARLVSVASGVSLIAFCVATLAVWNVEGRVTEARVAAPPPAKASFRAAFADVWQETQSRRFAVFIFISMIAYSAQDLILEPFAGLVFGLTPGETTRLSGVQNAGVLAGMVMVALAGTLGGRFARDTSKNAAGNLRSLKAWTIAGCIASAIALVSIALAPAFAPHWPLRASVFALGLANGAYAVAAIGSMMQLVGEGARSREGTRMGLWGAAQALAFGLGGLLGTLASDVARWLMQDASLAYSTVFVAEAVLFLLSAVLAARIGAQPQRQQFATLSRAG